MTLNRTYYGVLLAALSLCNGVLLEAQEPATPAPLAVIPLETYLENHTAVHAMVGGQPGTFLFDTGEGVSSISPTMAQKIGRQPWGLITGFRMTGERLDLPHCDDVQFELAGQKLVAPQVGVLDIMKLLDPDAPPLDGTLGLDIFAGKVITIIPRKSIVLESPASLAVRVANAKELPVRLVRDAGGVALTVAGAVQTSAGTAWMELDNGNNGGFAVANHIAPLLGLHPDAPKQEMVQLTLANGIKAQGLAFTGNFIMDGNLGAPFLNQWILTLDLEKGRAWLSPFSEHGDTH